MKKYAYVFSGQESERVGMFNDLIKEPTELNNLLDTLKETHGIDVRDAVVSKDAAVVAQNNQILLSLYHHLMAKLLINKIGYLPSYCLGHSFGQFSALTGAGAVDFIEMAAFVNKRMEVINSCDIVVRATFKSIHGMTLESFENFLLEENLGEHVELALHNQKEQIVCAVTKTGEEKLTELTSKYNYVLKDVHVSRPYHTSFMEEYNQRLLPYIEKLNFLTPHCPVIVNNSKKAIADVEGLRAETKIQMIQPVFWYDCIKKIEDEVDAFIILDPSESQSKILRRITNKKIHNINNMGIVKLIEKKGV